jgi:flagellin-specific chaperone FliS
MSTKEKILELLEQLDDEKKTQLLEEMMQMFEPKLDPILKAKLNKRADKSEEDIKTGRLHTLDEASKVIRQRLKFKLCPNHFDKDH